MLQNRVDPKGNIIQTSARGAWMGNRGQLHDRGKTILRPFKLKAWITCVLEFKDRHRQVMAPGLYTELFFLDEATAFAAGHRPCFECRREDAKKFKTAWLKGNPEYQFNDKTTISKIDDIIHAERLDKDGHKVTFKAYLKNLPDGVFIEIDAEPYLLTNKQIYHWTPFGYEQGQPLPDANEVTILTPKSIINAFAAGYQPQMRIED
ncbi:hypothetical protein [Mucilaginibacter jinjuensis]|uniref:Uncharacterized protein n=1 Tax=Mucilaginibacter jinjuensis TaxID=1176721 RepID=A0ABY7T2F3_9SPHI|nr:hypothetical protein [Mucilaginibacter jinjuensis]WCT10625.1 hypothetical protein PQO05_17960 [Mucilaginibacter jinjuensis]